MDHRPQIAHNLFLTLCRPRISAMQVLHLAHNQLLSSIARLSHLASTGLGVGAGVDFNCLPCAI